MEPTLPSIEFLPDIDLLIYYDFIISQEILKSSALQYTNEEVHKPPGGKFRMSTQ